MTRLRSYRNVAIQSFIQTISIAPLQYTITQRRSRHNMDTVSEFHAEAPQATASEGLAQGPTWRLERDSNPRPFGRKETNLLMSHNALTMVEYSPGKPRLYIRRTGNHLEETDCVPPLPSTLES